MNFLGNGQHADTQLLRKTSGDLIDLDQKLLSRPDDVQLLTKRGVLLRQLERFEESQAVLSSLAAAQADNVAVRHQLAVTLRLKGEFAGSLRLSEDILRDHPDHLPSILASIDANIQARQFDRALAAADQALLRLPDDVQLLTKRGVLLRQLDRLEESQAVLSSLAAAQSDNVAVRHQLAVTLRLKGEFAGSLRLSDDILRDHPDHLPSILASIDANIQARQFDLALVVADQALLRLPDDLQLLTKRGVLLRQLDRLEESHAVLSSLAAAQADNVAVRHQLAVTLRLKGEFAGSLRLSEDILRDHPDHLPSILASIDANIQARQFDRALVVADQALMKWPENMAIRLRRASSLFHMGDDSAQIVELRAAFDAEPGSAALAQALHAALVLNWKYDDADKVLQNFIGITSGTEEVRRQQIKFCLDTGEVSKALDLAQEWLAATPDSVEAMLAVYNAKVTGLQLDDLDELEERLILLTPNSEQLAISMAARRRAMLDLERSVKILDDFLSKHPKSALARARVAELLLQMQDFERCKTLLDDHLVDLPFFAITFASTLDAIGAGEEARALLARLEASVAQLANPANHDNVIMNIHRAYLQIDQAAADRIFGKVSNTSLLRPQVRHYFEMVAENSRPQSSPLAPIYCPPLHHIVFDPNPTPATIQPENLAIAKRILPPGANYDGWLKKIMKATTIDRWMNFCYWQNPESFEAFNGLVDCPDEHLLLEHSKRNQPFLVVGGHHGPQLAAWWLGKRFPNLRVVSKAHPILKDTSIAGAKLVVDGSAASGRELLAVIKSGAPIAGSLDQPHFVDKKYHDERFSIDLKLFDFPAVRVSNLFPRLAWKYGLPSYWIDSRVVGDRINIGLVRMPEPTRSNDFTQWARHWMCQYASNLEDYLRCGPQHLNMPNPLFTSLLQSIYENHRNHQSLMERI